MVVGCVILALFALVVIYGGVPRRALREVGNATGGGWGMGRPPKTEGPMPIRGCAYFPWATHSMHMAS